MPKQARAKRIRAKGRPLTDVEFSEMLIATSSVVGQSAKTSWRRLLIGLWLSGLRLEESLELTWGRTGEHHGGLWIDTAGKYPLLGIAAESEKGNTDRLLPMTPDFGEWLLRVPEDQRTGHVFPLTWQRHRGYRRKDTVSKVISEIGRQSGVTVNSDGKFASAHDLRRSFGLRWASSTKITPAELQALMRHTDISTTLGYYALVNATAFAEKLWESESK